MKKLIKFLFTLLAACGLGYIIFWLVDAYRDCNVDINNYNAYNVEETNSQTEKEDEDADNV